GCGSSQSDESVRAASACPGERAGVRPQGDRQDVRRPGDLIPVSAMPADGTFPSGTAVWEKRNIADDVPVWQPDLCIQCGQCGFVCPHSVIRAKYYDQGRLDGAPVSFKSAPVNARGYPNIR